MVGGLPVHLHEEAEKVVSTRPVTAKFQHWFCNSRWMQEPGPKALRGRAQPRLSEDCCVVQKHQSLPIDKPRCPGNPQKYQLINPGAPETHRNIN